MKCIYCDSSVMPPQDNSGDAYFKCLECSAKSAHARELKDAEKRHREILTSLDLLKRLKRLGIGRKCYFKKACHWKREIFCGSVAEENTCPWLKKGGGG